MVSERSRALEAIGISKRYGERDVLCAVDLIAPAGCVHGLLGPNGAGKSTLVRILLGLVRRDAGTVRLLGRPLDVAGAALPDGVAGVVDTAGFYPYLSGRKNLQLLARLDGEAATVGPGRVAELFEQVGLAAHADAAVGDYSAGMRQRLGIAAALLRSPRLLFLDEPTSALDPAGARDVCALIRHIAAQGAAVVLSSHDMAEVEQLCAAVTVIDRGHVLFSGAIDELRQRAPAAVHAITTSDDDSAFFIAAQCPDIRAARALDGGLELSGCAVALDRYVTALGRGGIAIRSLGVRTRSLESLFLQLTTPGAAMADVS